MIKVFTLNKNKKIELTEEELKKLLDEAYWEGYRANSHTWTYTTPNWAPYTWWSTSSCSTNSNSTDSNINYTLTCSSNTNLNGEPLN